jgi:predicted DsbA family dithiol-disulfide isomerase
VAQTAQFLSFQHTLLRLVVGAVSLAAHVGYRLNQREQPTRYISQMAAKATQTQEPLGVEVVLLEAAGVAGLDLMLALQLLKPALLAV